MSCRPITTHVQRLGAILAALACAASASGAAVITSVAPAEYRGIAPAKATSLRSRASAPRRRIDLPTPDAGEAVAMTSHNAARAAAQEGKGQPLAIGYGRDVPSAAQIVALSGLDWIGESDGSRTARIEIASPGAAAMRVALAMSVTDPGLSVRFAGSAASAEVFGDFPANAIAEETVRSGMYWSPVLAGDVATIELHAARDVEVAGVALRVMRVSHQLVTGAGLLSLSAKDTKAIGAAGACNIDIACIASPSPAVLAMAKAVAKLSFVKDDGRSYLCTGTLLNDSVQSSTPYLFGANHCLTSARAARTLNTYWFYDAATCNSKAEPHFVQLTGGAVLLGRSQDHDWALVRLLDAPPTGVHFAAWRAEAVPVGTTIASIHHPEGDVKKWSQGKSTADRFLDDGIVYGNFTGVIWSSGITEGGSSGAALLTLAPGGGYYEVRGGLSEGSSSCSRPTDPDYYTHLELALPLLRQYLTPDATNTAGLVVAVEFYNRTLDHYFLSTDPVEIGKLDTGATIGWERTGLRFLVFDHQVAGTNPVCRFYRVPARGDSHFYSASPVECAATAADFPADWIFESPNVFYAQLPDSTTGVCAANTRPVYRFYNAATINHRYTTEIVVRNELANSSLWTPEGYGPGPYYPVMCSVVQ